MNNQNIHPAIKEVLKTQVERKAPASLSQSIMSQVMRLHKAKFAVPNYDGIVLFGLILCVVFIAIPYLAPNGLELFSTQSISIPSFHIPMWVYTSVCIVILLFALDNIFSTLRLKKA